MNKTDYMNTLRQELEGLPADVVEDTMWAYEGRFVDGLVAGRDESAIAASLPAPHIVAAQKRASLRYQDLKKNVNPTNVASLLVALLGVLVFNLFMIIPAIVYSTMLFATYLGSLAFYVVGIVMTATVLSGVPQINLSIPSHHSQRVNGVLDEGFSHRHHGNVKVDITSTGITVNDEDQEDVASNAVTSTAASPTASASVTETGKVAEENSAVHVRIGNHLKSVHIFHGLGFLFGGIALFMLCLFMTKYTFIGFKNYLRWNISLLRPPVTA